MRQQYITQPHQDSLEENSSGSNYLSKKNFNTMIEKPVSIHTIETPHFTMRIFARRAKFSNRCAHIAEVTPKETRAWKSFTFNGVGLHSYGGGSYCSWKGKFAYINYSRPSRFLLSREVAEKLIPSLAKRNLPTPTSYTVFNYVGNSSNAGSTCKESVASYLVNYRAHRGNKDVTFKNNQPIDKRAQGLILRWAAKFGGIEFIDDSTLKISDWWCQNYARAGWLLLALRVANSEYIIPSTIMADAFQYFIDNGAVPESKKSGWGASSNWQYHFETNQLPYFEGGMDDPQSKK